MGFSGVIQIKIIKKKMMNIFWQNKSQKKRARHLIWMLVSLFQTGLNKHSLTIQNKKRKRVSQQRQSTSSLMKRNLKSLKKNQFHYRQLKKQQQLKRIFKLLFLRRERISKTFMSLLESMCKLMIMMKLLPDPI